jgi:hypothetical protein
MFYKVSVLNKNGKTLKIITSKVLSNRHWSLFEEQLKPSKGKKNKFNDFKKDKKIIKTHFIEADSFGLEEHKI